MAEASRILGLFLPLGGAKRLVGFYYYFSIYSSILQKVYVLMCVACFVVVSDKEEEKVSGGGFCITELWGGALASHCSSF